MPLSISVTPGITLTAGQVVTNDMLNRLGRPIVNLEGSIGSTTIADGSVTTPKLASGAVTTDKLALGSVTGAILAAGAVTYTNLAADVVSGLTAAPDIQLTDVFPGFNQTDTANRKYTTQLVFNGVNVLNAQTDVAADDRVPVYDVLTSPPGTERTNYVVPANLVKAGGYLWNKGVNNDARVRRTSAVAVNGTASYVLANDANGRVVVLDTVNVTATITTSGVNGLDAGVEAPDTLYYLWVIWNGSAKAALLSLSATSPTLPSGYTHRGLIGAVYNNSASDLESVVCYSALAQFTSDDVQPAGSAGTLFTRAHHLGEVPRNLEVQLVCVTGDNGYTAGDVVSGASVQSGSGSDNGLTVVVDTTNVAVVQGSSTLAVMNKTTGAYTGITLGNWRVRIQARL